MIRNMKAFGMAFAALAVMAVAGAATAQAGTFTAESYPVEVTGTQISGTVTGTELSKHEFSTVAGTVKCNTATFTGTASEASAQLTLKPTYSACTIAGIGATVNMNGCDYLFTAEATGGTDEVAIKTHVVCEGSNEIEVSVVGSTCKIKIPAQTLDGVTAKNTTTATPKKDVDAFIDVSGIIHTVENGSKCPNAPANGEYKTGTYKGVATLQGHKVGDASTPIGITVE